MKYAIEIVKNVNLYGKNTLSSDKFYFSIADINSQYNPSIKSSIFQKLGTFSKKPIQPMYEDIIVMALSVFALDKRFSRRKAYDAWTREFNINIPVLCCERWNAVKEKIARMLSFLSGDIWAVEFSATTTRINYMLSPRSIAKPYNQVADIYEACLNTYKETQFVRFALGMHPHQKMTERAIDKFQRFAEKACSIGEVGFDFSKASAKMQERQMNIFSSCLSLASEGKIFSIHSLRAEKQVYEILKFQNRANKYIMHWYCGDTNTLVKLAVLGCYFSINIKQLTSNQDIVRAIPRERILIESDAPIGSNLGKKFLPKDLSALYDRISCFFRN